MAEVGVVLITGAEDRLCRPLATLFAQYGARAIVLAASDTLKAREVAETSKGAATHSWYEAIVMQCYSQSRESVWGVAWEVVKQFGQINICINLVDSSSDGAEDALQICVEELLKVMAQQEERFVECKGYSQSIGRGAIVNVSETRGRQGRSQDSRNVVTQMTQRAGYAGSQNAIRVNGVLSSAASHQLIEGYSSISHADREMISRFLPAGRRATRDEICATVVHLAGAASGGVQGVTVAIDSGA